MQPTPVVHDPQADLAFLGARAVGERVWEIPVTPALVSLTGRLYGGAGIAAVTAAFEAATARPLRWVTCQFAAAPEVGDTLRVAVEEDARGQRTSQASAVVTCGDGVALRAVAALGAARAGATQHHWLEMPDVPPPEECDPAPFPPGLDSDVVELSERRLATGALPYEDGHLREAGFGVSMWTRMLDHDTGSAAMLAWVADWVPLGLATGLGERLGGSSLDNTLRMVASTSADWVLVDLRPTAAAEGYGHGHVHLWTPDGQLLATGAQTATLRPMQW